MSKHLFSDIRVPIENNNVSIQRIEEKCIKCGKCKEVCANKIAVANRFSLENTCDEAVCINCGQCAIACPVNAIVEVEEREFVKAAIKDPTKIVIFSTSPSVRAALGEEFGLANGTNVEGKMVALLKKLGANYVFDTTFAADLTIMEEASELIERITTKKTLPQFTSCCPAWVKYVETFEPEFIPNLSSAKSPIGMQGPTIKTYFAKSKNINAKNIINVAITPCVAKKYEIRRDEMNASGKYLNNAEIRDMDYVITTRELALWAKEEKINFNNLANESYDDLLGRGSGAGIIFGNTGGVMEAALRTAYFMLTNTEPPKQLLDLKPVRGLQSTKEASININGLQVNVAVLFGTNEAKVLLDKIKRKEVSYHFVEVMTCPGGCIGGGGQPKNNLTNETYLARIKALYHEDEQLKIRLSHMNPDIIHVYHKFYGKPLSELSEKMLHTKYEDKSEILNRKNLEKKGEKKMKKFVCPVCGYIHEGESAPEKCPLCGVAGSRFIEQKEEMEWAAEHVVGVAKGAREDIINDLRMNFNGECSEVGMYLAMSRVAIREGYPEIGEFYHRAALEEAEHAAKFAELLGEVVTDSTKKNLEMRVEAENGATAGKVDLAKRAKELNLDAIHDTVHEMARDEARHGKGFAGLLKRYFGE